MEKTALTPVPMTLTDTTDTFDIVSLSDYPHYLDALVDQQWQVWGYDEREDLLEFFKLEFCDKFPRTWLLLDTKKAVFQNLVGAVTLSLNEMGDCQLPERNPWLGYLYVEPNYRGQGLAKLLTQFAVNQAYHMGFEHVYLYASDETARYQHWGWRILETLEFQDEIINVMQENNIKLPSQCQNCKLFGINGFQRLIKGDTHRLFLFIKGIMLKSLK